MKEILFSQSELGRSAPDRPLGNLSNYVAEEMPGVLEDIHMGSRDVASLVAHSEAMALDVSPAVPLVLLDSRLRDLADLDAKMLETAIVHSGGEPGNRLMQLVDVLALATDIPAGVTYEDLIFINPLTSDPRTFTSGAVGSSERDFYLGHRLIEDQLDLAVSNCRGAIGALSNGGHSLQSAVEQLGEATESFGSIDDLMRSIGMSMPRDHFGEFRRNLTGNPARNLKGPSGLFTGGIPALDFLLGGIRIESEYPSLDSDLRYYPRKGRVQIEEARQIARDGRSLFDSTKGLGSPSELVDAFAGMSNAIRRFRGLHYKGVSHQIPEAVAGTIAGTGGELSPGQFLRQRMTIDHGSGDL